MIERISVFLADDDLEFRRVYRRLINGTDEFRVSGEAGTGQEAASKLRSEPSDVALIDVQMPNGSGLDVVRAIDDTDTQIIMLTTFDLDEYVSQALTAGAVGFLLKNAAVTEVLSAIRAVHAGHSALAPEVTGRLVEQFSGRRRLKPHAFANVQLSTRELQVVRLIAQGKKNHQIAKELCLSVPTVRTYLHRLFVKLRVNDRTQLAVLAHEAGLMYRPR